MARKSFAVNTDPHVAEVLGKELKFLPEVVGAEFADAYAELMEVQLAVGDGTNVDPASVVAIDVALNSFLSKLMLPESREEFSQMKLPSRILTEMLEFVVECYSGNGPATS